MSCSSSEKKTGKFIVLDSLKKAYAGKNVGITLTKNQSGTEPLTTQYAYTDENKSDLAFEIYSCQASDNKYRMAVEEGFTVVETTEPKVPTDMILIEQVASGTRGYVPYSFIRELDAVPYYITK